MKSAKSSNENMATICIKVDEDSASKQEPNTNQVKTKRRNKLKMPLRKIPKRKQSSLTEQINLCQDIGLSGSDENPSDSSQGGPSSAKQTVNSAAARKSAREENAIPPLVSFVRPSQGRTAPQYAGKAASIGSGTVLTVGGTNLTKVAWQLPQIGCSRTDIKVGRPSYPTHSSSQPANFPSFNHGQSEEFQRRWEPREYSVDAAAAPVSGSRVRLQPSRGEKTSDRTESTLKTMKPSSRCDATKQLTLPCKRAVPPTEAKRPLCLNRQCFNDMNIPLVHVKAPVMAPISPETKRVPTGRKALLMKKNGNERGRKPNERYQQIKENYCFKDTRSPTRKSAIRPAKRPCNDITDSDDDDVVITGVVRLDHLQPDSINSIKYADNRRRRRIEEGPVASQQANRYTQDPVRSQGSIFFSKRKQLLKKEPENFRETWIDGEPSEPRQCYSQDMFESQSESPAEDNRLINNNRINTERKTFSNDVSSQIEIQSSVSNVSQRINEVRSRKPDVFDWKSVLNLNADDNKKAKGECAENGSTTDSGSDDDLVLRDLSEFLLLSEFRRNSKKEATGSNAYGGSQPLSGIGNLIDFDSIDSSVNLINTIDPDFNAILDDHDKRNNCRIESPCYSPWQSAFDNYPKYPLHSRFKNRGEAYWKGYLQSDRDPTLSEADRYEFKSSLADRDRCIREFLDGAGMILESESAERGVAPSYEYQFYRKRIYRKNRKDSGSRIKSQQDIENEW